MSAAPYPRIELRGVSKHFGKAQTRVDALVDISLSVNSGEVVGLLGPSGSGKSTLLNVMGCIVEPNAGWMRLNDEVLFDGKWLQADLRRLRREKLGFIFQTHNLIPFLTSRENVAIVQHLVGAEPAIASARAIELLDYLGVGHRQHAYPSELSGGEAQRVAIARALANEPQIILADEPTAALDSERAGKVMDLLRRVATDKNAAVVVVSHDEKIFGRFDRLFRLRDGRLVATETQLPASNAA
jgi:putative ABC transport system ATP-binding protein